MRPCGMARECASGNDNEYWSKKKRTRLAKREEPRGNRTDDRYTPFSFVRRGEIETANRVGVDEGEGREKRPRVAKRGD